MILRRFRFRNQLLIKKLLNSFALLFLSLFFCEYLVFVIFISRCDWPSSLDHFQMRSLVFSDTHLFGTKRGHFLDKLKREWQMHIAFKLAVQRFKPNTVLFLGDVLDEGLIASKLLIYLIYT